MSATTIRERRQILLPLQVVVAAVAQLDRLSEGAMPEGEVVGAEIVRNGAGGDGLRIAVLSASDSVIEWRQFGMESIAAAIIGYCRSKRIPLPYHGAKSVVLTDEGAAFSIENTVDLARKPDAVRSAAGGAPRYARGYEPYALAPLSPAVAV